MIVVTPYLGQPVDANSIKLPTDGFNAPNEAARLFGMQESANGVAGQPLPSAAQGPVPAAPAISQAQTEAVMPSQPSAKDKKRRKQRTAASDVAAPGFSF